MPARSPLGFIGWKNWRGSGNAPSRMPSHRLTHTRMHALTPAHFASFVSIFFLFATGSPPPPPPASCKAFSPKSWCCGHTSSHSHRRTVPHFTPLRQNVLLGTSLPSFLLPQYLAVLAPAQEKTSRSGRGHSPHAHSAAAAAAAAGPLTGGGTTQALTRRRVRMTRTKDIDRRVTSSGASLANWLRGSAAPEADQRGLGFLVPRSPVLTVQIGAVAPGILRAVNVPGEWRATSLRRPRPPLPWAPRGGRRTPSALVWCVSGRRRVRPPLVCPGLRSVVVFARSPDPLARLVLALSPVAVASGATFSLLFFGGARPWPLGVDSGLGPNPKARK